jgi:putative acetyltransferase
MALEVLVEDPSTPEITELLEVHLTFMRSISPPESVHALDVEALRTPTITFWTVRDESDLLGCGALKELSEDHGEIKSMHSREAARGKGVAQKLLDRLIEEAQSRGYRRLSLETGNTAHFFPAHRLYQRNGFGPSPPFANYKEDPHSIFMTREL